MSSYRLARSILSRVMQTSTRGLLNSSWQFWKSCHSTLELDLLQGTVLGLKLENERLQFQAQTQHFAADMPAPTIETSPNHFGLKSFSFQTSPQNSQILQSDAHMQTSPQHVVLALQPSPHDFGMQTSPMVATTVGQQTTPGGQ